MSRWALRIFVFLLLGAIVNVAVAWALMRWSRPTGGRTFGSLESHRYLDERQLGYEPQAPSSGLETQGFGAWSVMVAALTNQESLNEPQPTGSMLYIRDVGWPLLTLRTEWRWIGPEAPLSSVLHHGLHTSLRDSWSWSVQYGAWRTTAVPFALPTCPIWPGFAINTVFYAGVLWLLFAGPFVLRRWRRIRRGLCPKCAYDLRGRPLTSDTCPECGTR